MSDPLKIAFVVEGPTDQIILEALVEELLDGKDFLPQCLQPEMSNFKVVPGKEGGWGGVYKWCKQSTDQANGKLGNNALFANYDLLIFQIDADVAARRYWDYEIVDPFPNTPLPCKQPCPPASATTDKLRELILLWMGEKKLPARTILCIPSKALESWLLVALFPDDPVALNSNIECRHHPERFFRRKPEEFRLVIGNKKISKKYEDNTGIFIENWATVKERCLEASRFETDFLSAFQELAEGN